MNSIKHFAKSTVVYCIGSVLTKVISFLLLPLYTGKIATDAMGYYNVSTTCLSVVTSVLCLEIWTGILRFMFDHQKKEDRYSAVFNGMTIFSGSLVLYILLFVLLRFVAPFQNIGLISLYGLSVMLQSVYCSISRGLEFNTTFAVSGIIGSLVNSCTNIVLILFLHMGIEAMYIAGISGFLIQVIILESRVRLLSHFRKKYLDKIVIKKMLLFSLPLSLNAVSYWMLTGYNNVAISNILGMSENGIFSVAARFSIIMTTVATCFTMAWQELVYSKGNDTDRTSFYSKASDYYLKFLLFALIILIPSIKIAFPLLVKPAYNAAFYLVPLNLLASVASILSSFYGNIFSAEKKTKIIFAAAFGAAIVNVCLLHLLIGKLGAQAANISLFCGFMTDIFIKVFALKRQVKLKIDYAFLGIGSLLFIASFCIYLKLNNIFNLLFLLIALLLMAFTFRDILRLGFKKGRVLFVAWKTRKNL